MLSPMVQLIPARLGQLSFCGAVRPEASLNARRLAEDGNLASSKGDYYRVKTELRRPPATGWGTVSCPRGAGTSPPTVTVVGAPDDDGADPPGVDAPTTGVPR